MDYQQPKMIGTRGAGTGTEIVVQQHATDHFVGINNVTPTVALDVTGAAKVSGTLAVTGNTTLTGDLAVNGGDITTSAATFNLVNATATTVNLAGAAGAVNIGLNGGSTVVTLNTGLDASSSTVAGVVTPGGLGVAKKIIGGTSVSAGTTMDAGGKVTSGTTTLGNTPPTANNDLTRKDYVLGRFPTTLSVDLGPSGTAARAFDATYTNSGASFMVVYVYVLYSTTAMPFLVNGVTVASIYTASGNAGTTITMFVPPGVTYRVNGGGIGTLLTWFEQS